MDINDLTLGQAKELAAMFGGIKKCEQTLNGMIGKKVIIRTYSAGVHFGTLVEKAGNEVILKNARRMWQWKAAESISLSGCALYGIDQKNSRIAPPVDSIWLEAIEIIPCTKETANSIEESQNAKAQ